MRNGQRRALLLVAVLCANLGAGTALAGLDIDFGARVRIGDEDDLFISVAANYYDQDSERVRSLAYRYKNDADELAVAMFISARSGRSAEWVYRERRDGHSWWQISVRAGLSPDVWFVPVRRDPGPPYGKAYGHWKKHRRERSPFVLTDEDARHLVAVRMIHEYYDVPIDMAMQRRASGRNLRGLMAEEYRRRHGRDESDGPRPAAGEREHGKGKSKRHR